MLPANFKNRIKPNLQFDFTLCPARHISIPLSEIYYAYHVTDSARTVVGPSQLLVHPTTEVAFSFKYLLKRLLLAKY